MISKGILVPNQNLICIKLIELPLGILYWMGILNYFNDWHCYWLKHNPSTSLPAASMHLKNVSILLSHSSSPS